MTIDTETVLEQAMSATEKAKEGLEDFDGVVDVVEVVKSNPMVLVAVGVAGLVAGAVGGYFFAKNQLRSYYEDLSSQEIAEAKEFYANLNKVGVDGEPLSPMDVLEHRHGPEAVEEMRSRAAAEVTRRYQGVESVEEAIAEAKDEQGHPSDEEVDEAQIQKLEAIAKKKPKTQYRNPKLSPETNEEREAEETYEEYKPTPGRNVFEDNSFNYDEELAMRTEDSPYIITHDEFYAGEKDYDTVELTYFSLDDTLVGEDSQPMERTDEIVGDDHLMRFGSGSKDPNTVFIRNDRLETDYEIKRSSGSYLEEVLGLMADDDEKSLKHSDQRDRRREFRRGDE